jgi:hypothetical protein
MKYACIVRRAAAVVMVCSACSGPELDPQSTPQEIAAQVGKVLAAAGEMAGDQSGTSDAAAGLMGAIDPFLGGALASVRSSLEVVGASLASDPSFTLISAAVIRAVHQRDQELRRLLEERVLTLENLETEGEGELVYLLGAESTCRPLDAAPAPDPACVQLLQAVPVRARVTTAPSGSYRVQFLIGPERIEPLMVQVSSLALNAYLYLPQLKSSSALIAAALVRPDPLPARMDGQLRVSLSTREDAVELLLYAPFDISIADEASGSSLLVTSAHELGRLLIFSAYAETGRRSLQTSFGPLDLVVPWRPGPAGAGGMLRVFLAGLEGQLAYWEGQRRLTAAQLTLGRRPSSVEVRGERIVELLLNPNPRDAYDFRLAVEPDAQGLLTLEVEPRLEFQINWNLAAVAAELPAPPPPYLANQSYQLNLEGPREDVYLGARLEELATSSPDDRRGLRVARGELSLYASGAPAPLDAVAGQCLLHRTPAPEDHPILGALEVAACPVPASVEPQ